MLMRLDINKALFWLIKTPPGKKNKQKKPTKTKRKKPWDHFGKPLSFLMVLFGIGYNFLNQNTSFVHILQKTVAISKLEAMWSYLHYIASYKNYIYWVKQKQSSTM